MRACSPCKPHRHFFRCLQLITDFPVHTLGKSQVKSPFSSFDHECFQQLFLLIQPIHSLHKKIHHREADFQRSWEIIFPFSKSSLSFIALHANGFASFILASRRATLAASYFATFHTIYSRFVPKQIQSLHAFVSPVFLLILTLETLINHPFLSFANPCESRACNGLHVVY